MPVPSSINDLSTTASSNSPPGSESPATLDDYLRAHASFTAQLRDFRAADAANITALQGRVGTAGGLSFRNKLYNSNFTSNVRNVSGTVSLAAGAYGHDGWKAGASGCTYTFATSNGITTLTITAGSLQRVVEGDSLESGTHVLSWSGTAQGKIGAGGYAASGVTGSVTGGISIAIEFNAGTLSKPQFEMGSTPTTYEFLPAEIDRLRTMRYVQVVGYGFCGVANSSTSLLMAGQLAVPMRGNPTATGISGGGVDGLVRGGGGVETFNTYVNIGTSTLGAWLSVGSAGFTLGATYACIKNNLLLSAEQ
jgi:hypothetical protein